MIKLEKHSVSWVTLVCALILFVIVVAALTALVARQLASRHANSDDVCGTEDCVSHGRALLAGLNLSVDPCVNFYQYVCGHVAQGFDEDRVSRMYARKVEDYIRYRNKPGADNQGVGARLEAMFTPALNLCLQRPSVEDPTAFVEFMRERGLRWPYGPELPDNRTEEIGNPLFPILVDLSLNWRVSLWFDVNVMHSETEGEFIITLDEPGPVPVLRMEQLGMLGDDAYDRVAQQVAAFLSGGAVTLSQAELTDLRLDEGIVRNTLSFRQRDPEGDGAAQADATISIKEVSRLTKGVGAEEWLGTLQKLLHGAVGMGLSADTKVLALSRARIHHAFIMLEDLPSDVALNVTGWMFSYIYIWTMDPRFDAFTKTGTKHSNERSTSTLCFLGVHEMFGLALVAPYFSSLYGTEERRRIEGVFQKIMSALISIIKDADSVTASTKQRAEEKLRRHMKVHLWPPEPFFRLDKLDDIYAAFATEATSVFALWVRTRTALRASRTNRYYGSLMTERVRWFAGSTRYIYSSNSFKMGVWAVLAPSYMRRGSDLMTFSGLGFQIARSLVRAVDDRGRMLNATGVAWSAWERRRNCSIDFATIREIRDLAERFALNVSVRALTDNTPARRDSSKIPFLDSMTGSQTFFVSFCSHFCDDEERASLCDVAMSSALFRDAFHCKDHNMPKSHCEFL
ncbi:neprilysin-2-like [Amblyomma americanum]